jgi:high affinity sulfate transporter 1
MRSMRRFAYRLSHAVPGLQAALVYRWSWLPRDLFAGAVLMAVLVPVGMGYAEAAGLPAIYGLYATIVPLAAYALFGPSRIMVLGPDSSLAAVIAATIIPLAAGDADQAVALAGAMAVVAGLAVGVSGLARLGFVTELFSHPVRLGYLNGIALTILVSQLPKVFGFSVEAEGLPQTAYGFLQGLWKGETLVAAAVLGLGAIGLILLLRHLLPVFPAVLVAVVGGMAAVAVFDLAAEGVAVVGVLPQGLPSFAVPALSLADLQGLAAGALGVALVAAADTSVLSLSLAAERGEEVDPNQELVALGVANVATGFFQGFPISSSSSRTPVAVTAGARSQLAPLTGAIGIALMLVLAPGLLRTVPQPVLGAVVVTAALSLISVTGVARLFRVRRVEGVISVAAFLAIAFTGVITGIFLAVALSLGDFVRRAWRPHDASLGRVPMLKGYHDVMRHPEADLIPGLLLYRFDAPLFFANAGHFRRRVLRLLAGGGAVSPIRWVVVAAEPITDVDTSAADVLRALHEELSRDGVVLAFAEMKGPVKDRLRRYGIYDAIGDERFYPTLGKAVHGYVEATGIRWVDWEERSVGPADGVTGP